MKAGDLASSEKWFCERHDYTNKAFDYAECFGRCRLRAYSSMLRS
jgi:hypothetical protein